MFGARSVGSVAACSGRNDSVISTGPKLKVQLPECWGGGPDFPPASSANIVVWLLILLALSYFRGPALSSVKFPMLALQALGPEVLVIQCEPQELHQ